MISKLRRTFTSILPVDAGRTGHCNGCGACCELPTRCTFLKTDSDGKSTCSIYKFRPPNCRKFPRSQAQLDSVVDTCSFSFEKDMSGETVKQR